jgi:uncharacterized tellurite resistance protein B-like protein
MLDRLFGARNRPAPLPANDIPIAAAALMVEAALMDGSFDPREREAIRDMLVERLEVSPDDADVTVAEAEARVLAATDHWSFARVLKNRLDEPARIGILEMLWEVAYADGHLDYMETALIRRVAGLLYVPDQDSGAARRRVRERLGLGLD